MFCPRCGKEVQQSSLFCSSCGAQLGASASGGASGGTAVQSTATSGTRWWAWLAMAAVSLLVIALMLPQPLPPDIGSGAGSPAERMGEVIGYKFGGILMTLLLPAVIAYLIAGRKAVRNGNRFALIFCALAIFFCLAGTAGNFARTWETPEQRITRLLREASGQQAARVRFGVDAQVDDTLRDFFRATLEGNRKYAAQTQQLDVSAFRHLYTAESFVEPATARAILEESQRMLDLDLGREQELRNQVEATRARVQGLDLNESERKQVLEGFDQSVGSVYAVRGNLVGAERDWIESIQEVYRTALENQGRIRHQNDHLVIANPTLLATFNRELNRSLELRDRFQAAQKEYEQKIQAMQRDTGVNPAEFEKLKQ